MGFEKLRVYQAAVLLDKIVIGLIKRAPKGYGKDIDQLKRAIGSIIGNIAEAYSQTTVGQTIYHLGKARGSSDEARAWLRRLVAEGAFNENDITRAVPLTVTIAKMLTSWIERLEGEQ